MKTKVINGITYTHRTRTGVPARIVCTDLKCTYPVIALCLLAKDTNREYVVLLTEDLRHNESDIETAYDLFEGVEPETDWSKVAIDTKVFVRNSDDGAWLPRYFAGKQGQYFHVWHDGTTSFSAGGFKVLWIQIKLAEEN